MFITPPQDPSEILEAYGADALRLYLVNSPVVHAETLRFKKEGVFGVVKDVFLPWRALSPLARRRHYFGTPTGSIWTLTTCCAGCDLCTSPAGHQEAIQAVDDMQHASCGSGCTWTTFERAQAITCIRWA